MKRVLLYCSLLFSSQALGAQTYSDKELGTKALGIVIADLKNGDSELRAKAADVLGNAGNKAAVEILKNLLLNDPDKHVRITAAEALWKLDSPAGIRTIYAIVNDLPAKEPIDHSPLVELKTISQNKIREHAIEAVVRIKGEKAVDLLFTLKNDTFGAVRDVAARELARLGYDEEMTRFLDALGSEDEAIRYQSATVFAKICNNAALDKLKETLDKETSTRVKTAVLEAIACVPGRKAAVEALLALTDEENPTLKYKAVAALAGVKDKKVSAKFAEINSATTDIRLKLAMLPALLPASGKAGLEAVERGLDALSPEVRMAAVNALENFKPQEAKPLLAAALSDESEMVRLEASLGILRRVGKK